MVYPEMCIRDRIENLLEQAAHVVIVTNEIFSDAVVFDGDMDLSLIHI